MILLNSQSSYLKQSFLATLPVMAGYLVLGFGFGVIMYAKGYGILWTLSMSLFVYAGSLQYAGIHLLTGGVSLLTAAVTSLAVNARHFFYGLSMIERYKNQKGKPLLIFCLTDETYSLVCRDPKGVAPSHWNKYYLLVSLFDYAYWVVGSALGALLGTMLRFNTAGIDFALTALFLTVLVDQWRSSRDHTAALVGIFASLLCLLVFGKDNFLIPAMLLITASLTLLRKKEGITNA